MSLFDKLKTTRFKSLKYGDDSFGGGDSLEPIIQTPIRDDNPVGVEKPAKDVAAENQSRITYLLDKTSRGAKFLTNQRNLQLSNPRLEATSETNSKTRITSLMYYTKELTLSQIGKNPALEGEHYTRFGISPFMDDDLKYTNIVTKNNTPGDKSSNRLVSLQNKLQVGRNSSVTLYNFKATLRNTLTSIAKGINSITGIFNIFGGNQIINRINDKVNLINKVSTPFLTPTIDSYLGGPNSINGVGFTTIRRFDYTNNQEKINALKELSSFKASQGKIDPNILKQASGASFKYNSDPNSEQFNVELPKATVSNKFTDLQRQQIKQHAYYGGSNVKEPGSQSTNYNYVVALRNPKQKVVEDRTSPTFNYFGPNKQTVSLFDRNDGDNMSVVFELINPFTGDKLQRVIFSAYINGFKINSDATWNDISYIGRSENLYVYSKFKRTASFNLQIPCFNIVELREKHRALGALESSLAGSYSEDNKLGGILTKLYLGNYLRGEVGIINNISYDIPNDSSWDLDDQLAHNINVAINFTIIHNDLPTYRGDGGFLKNIPNAANGFISNFDALNKAGATSIDDVNNTTNRFIKINRTNNTTIQSEGALATRQVNQILDRARATIATPTIPKTTMNKVQPLIPK